MAKFIVFPDKQKADKARKVLEYHPNGEPAKMIDPIELKTGEWIANVKDKREIEKIKELAKSDYQEKEVDENDFKDDPEL